MEQVSSQKDKNLLQVNNLSFTYHNKVEPTLTDISFSLAEGAFAALVGPNGSGKSTLLRLLKPSLAPHGALQGSCTLGESELNNLSLPESAYQIGMVLQNPSSQLVTDTVQSELAFGLENLGTHPSLIRRRIAELASFFGMEHLMHAKTAELSEGQKQQVNLASILAMQPRLILLDEPLGQLDPLARESFVRILERVNKELGVTLLVATHELNELSQHITQVISLNNKRIAFNGGLQEYLNLMLVPGEKPVVSLPRTAQIASRYGKSDPYPLTVRDARVILRDEEPKDQSNNREIKQIQQHASSVLTAKDVWYRYDRQSPSVLTGVDLSIQAQDIHAILGANGSGKSTLLKLLVGVLKPSLGKVKYASRHSRGLLVQDPKMIFHSESVADELGELTPEGRKVIERFNLRPLLDQHPYDISGGEQQLIALALLMNHNPDIVMLDEPTKYLDASARNLFMLYLKELQQTGKTIVLVTHDIEFVAETANTTSLLFDGTITTSEPTQQFMQGNLFYTTVEQRIFSEGVLYER